MISTNRVVKNAFKAKRAKAYKDRVWSIVNSALNAKALNADPFEMFGNHSFGWDGKNPAYFCKRWLDFFIKAKRYLVVGKFMTESEYNKYVALLRQGAKMTDVNREASTIIGKIQGKLVAIYREYDRRKKAKMRMGHGVKAERTPSLKERYEAWLSEDE